MRYTIHVTSQHLAKKQHTSFSCPVALALHEQLPATCLERQASKILVHSSMLTLYDCPSLRIPLPRSVMDFIVNYDTFPDREVKPFSFTIDLPAKLPINEL